MSHPPTKQLARCALFAALLCICAWISIPLGDISFTMQTFGLFLTLGLLGGKWGSAAFLVYLALGTVGLPVFSGFRGGIGILLGTTGGYIWGFGVAALLYWAVTALAGDKPGARLAGMILGLLGCYGCGTAWYAFAYLDGSAMTLAAVTAKCVLPYLLPDAIKLAAAFTLTQKLRRAVR